MMIARIRGTYLVLFVEGFPEQFVRVLVVYRMSPLTARFVP